MREKRISKEIDFKEMAQAFLEGAGGRENIISCYNCITRLRLKVKEHTAVDEKKIKDSGAAAVFWQRLICSILSLNLRFLMARDEKALWKNKKLCFKQ